MLGLKSEIANQNVEIRSLRLRLLDGESNKIAFNSMEEEKKQLEHTLITVRKKLQISQESCKDKSVAIRKEKLELQEELAELRSRQVDLENDLAHAQLFTKHAAKQGDEILRLRDVVEDLQAEIRDHRLRAKDVLEQRISSALLKWKKEMTELKRFSKTLQSNLTDSEQEKDQLQAKVLSMEQKVQYLKKSRARERAENIRLREELEFQKGSRGSSTGHYSNISKLEVKVKYNKDNTNMTIS